MNYLFIGGRMDKRHLDVPSGEYGVEVFHEWRLSEVYVREKCMLVDKHGRRTDFTFFRWEELTPEEAREKLGGASTRAEEWGGSPSPPDSSVLQYPLPGVEVG